jgi:hypothetical protein
MNEPNDTQRAWTFVSGFDVPKMNDATQAAWQSVIDRLTVDQFQRAARTSRNVRPVEQRHLRPSTEAFMGYAAGGSVSANEAIAETSRHLAEQRDTTPAGNDHVQLVIAEARATLGPTHKRTEQRHYKIPGG